MIVILLLLAVGGLAYFLAQKTTPTVAMPDLVGKTETAALQKLSADGIRLKNVESEHSKVAVGFVISTKPKAGTTLKKDQKVNLTVSLGVQAAIITIPSVMDMSLTSATSELENMPYLLTVHTRLSPDGASGHQSRPEYRDIAETGGRDQGPSR